MPDSMIDRAAAALQRVMTDRPIGVSPFDDRMMRRYAQTVIDTLRVPTEAMVSGGKAAMAQSSEVDFIFSQMILSGERESDFWRAEMEDS